MRIGVVCEGLTDLHAITYFFGHALQAAHISAEFVALQPPKDKTKPDASWGHVFHWLNNNPPITRVPNYFGGGLFAGALAVQPLDALLIQLDSDVLGEPGFNAFVKSNYGFQPTSPSSPDERGAEVIRILEAAGRFSEMTELDVARHVPTPAVESTETWCVAAYSAVPDDFESFPRDELTLAFMQALERSEGREPEIHYARVDKSPQRREKFCKRHAVGSARVIGSCPQFRRSFNSIRSLD